MTRLDKFRNLANPEDGLRALAEHAPQAEAFAEQQLERFRPALAWFYDARRRLATAAVVLFTAWLFLHVVFGANGMVIYRQKSTEYKSLQKEVDSLEKENQRYAEQIKGLKSDPKMIEKEAREQLHYTRPGEVVYVSPAPPPQPSRTTNSAKR